MTINVLQLFIIIRLIKTLIIIALIAEIVISREYTTPRNSREPHCPCMSPQICPRSLAKTFNRRRQPACKEANQIRCCNPKKTPYVIKND